VDVDAVAVDDELLQRRREIRLDAVPRRAAVDGVPERVVGAAADPDGVFVPPIDGDAGGGGGSGGRCGERAPRRAVIVAAEDARGAEGIDRRWMRRRDGDRGRVAGREARPRRGVVDAGEDAA
jgi:hypothetical protein